MVRYGKIIVWLMFAAGIVISSANIDLSHSMNGKPGYQKGESSILHIKPRYYRWFVDPGVEWVEKNTGYAYLNWGIPLSKAALVMVDVWDRHYLKDTEERAEGIIQKKIMPLLTICRKRGFRIIHAPSPDLDIAYKHPAWIGASNKGDKKTKENWPPKEFRDKSGEYKQYAHPKEPREDERRELVSGLSMHPDVQVEGNEVVVATGEELHRYCEENGILFLFYLGFNTNACIVLRDYGTIEMHKRGYDIIIVRDCTTGMESFKTHDALSQTKGTILMLEMFGKYSITSEELIKGLLNIQVE